MNSYTYKGTLVFTQKEPFLGENIVLKRRFPCTAGKIAETFHSGIEITWQALSNYCSERNLSNLDFIIKVMVIVNGNDMAIEMAVVSEKEYAKR